MAVPKKLTVSESPTMCANSAVLSAAQTSPPERILYRLGQLVLDIKPEFDQRFSSDGVFEHRTEALHRLTSEPRLRYDEIIVLVLDRDEPELVLPGDCLDRDPPIGSVLRDRETDSVVRLRLRPVTSWLCSSESAICQNAGAAADVAIDHQAILPDNCAANGVLDRPPVEARVTLPVDDSL